MENFDNFYQKLNIEELKKLVNSGKINQSNLYDFLIGYSLYLKQQRDMDSF